MELDAQIEGILFYKGEPMKVWDLARLTRTTPEEVESALIVLEEKLRGRGLSLIRNNEEIMLGTAAELSSLLETIRKDEISRELSRASLETLSVILYKNGAARSDIDYIRGVNSSFILRNLMVRGLIEKTTHPTDSRKVLYIPTMETLTFMGLSKLEDLPEFVQYHDTLTQHMDSSAVSSEAEKENK